MKTIYKYVSLADRDLTNKRRLIVDRELYFSDPKDFNDPLDCNIGAWNNARLQLHKAYISCFSQESRNDDLMFAHYADSHRGMRLRFDVDMAQTLSSEISVLGSGRPVLYVNEIPKYDEEHPHHLYLIKSDVWKYENEFRVFLTRSQLAVYEPQELVEVAFGARTSTYLKRKVRSWLCEASLDHVRLVQAVPSENNMSFEYRLDEE